MSHTYDYAKVQNNSDMAKKYFRLKNIFTAAQFFSPFRVII